MDNRYQELVEFLFNREEAGGDWRFEFSLEEPNLTGDEVVEFVRRMLEHYETDLSGYSDWQLGLGIDFIFNNSCSDMSFHLRDGPVDMEKRISAILALKSFFQKCLNKRCLPVLGHLSEDGNQLNHFCYMLWDTTPLNYCEDIPEKEKMYAVVAEVMEYSLSLDNIACVESGLHGLGHLATYYEDAPKMVRKFIESGHCKDERLLTYARRAEQGCVL